MGLFSSTASSPPPPKTSPDGHPEAPSRSQRLHCWEGRDAFFACLDAHGIVDSLKDDKLARENCSKEGVRFERECASSWVQYFKKRRVMEHQRAQTLAKIKREDAAAGLGGTAGEGAAGTGGVGLGGK